MQKILRVAKFLVLSVVALLLIAVGTLLALRAHFGDCAWIVGFSSIIR